MDEEMVNDEWWLMIVPDDECGGLMMNDEWYW